MAIGRNNADDAYLASLSALYDPVVVSNAKKWRNESEATAKGSSLEEVVAVKREALRHGNAGTRIPISTGLQKWIVDVCLLLQRVEDGDGKQSGLLLVNESDILPRDFDVPKSYGGLSIPVGAAILGRLGQENMDRVFLAMCAPDANSRVKMGAYNMLDKLYERYAKACGGWLAPLEMAAMYHGNHEVARDLAFSWFHLYRGDTFDSIVHLSVDEIIAQVEASPRGSSIGISSRTEHVVEHGADEVNAVPIELEHRTPMNWCLGPRPRYPEDHELTREQVLATLQTPSEMLLQALEAAAVPVAEWVEAEKRALDILLMRKDDEKITWLYLDRLEHREFLEAHAPYHVRRLHNGGVMLATHPYRYLWPLWAKALDLLGIRSLTR